MRNPNATFISEKNKQENQPVRIYEIYDYDGEDSNLYFAEWDSDITFDSQVYTKFPITIEAIGENGKGEIDTVRLTVENVSRTIQGYLETYDLRGKKVSIKTVWANQLADANAYIEDVYYIDSYTADQMNVVFDLTSKLDVLNVQLPLGTYSRTHCRWKFKSDECGYSGGESSCNRTLQRCRELSNQSRFGGFPSIPQRRIFFS